MYLHRLDRCLHGLKAKEESGFAILFSSLLCKECSKRNQRIEHSFFFRLELFIFWDRFFYVEQSGSYLPYFIGKREKEMQQKVPKKILVFLAAVMLFAGLTGCTQSGEQDKISFSKVICRYELHPSFSDNPSINYLVYADNTVVRSVEFSPEEYIEEKRYTISEEQKQTILDAIRQNRLWNLGNCSNNDATDQSFEYIILFDETGEKVHTCGGYNPTNKRFQNAAAVILQNVQPSTFPQR